MSQDARPTSIPVTDPEPLVLLNLTSQEDVEALWAEARAQVHKETR